MFKPSFIDEVSHSWSESKPIMSNPQQQTSVIWAIIWLRRFWNVAENTQKTLRRPEHLYPDLRKPYTGTWTRHQFNTGIRLIHISACLLCVLVPDPLLLFLLTNDTLVTNGVDVPLQANELRPVVSFRVKRYYTFVGHKSWKNGIPTWSCAGQKNEGLWVNADRKNERDAWRVPRTATGISGLETVRGNKRINLRNKKDYSYRLCFIG